MLPIQKAVGRSCVFRVARTSASSILRVPEGRTISSMTKGCSQTPLGIKFPPFLAHARIHSPGGRHDLSGPQNWFTSPASWFKGHRGAPLVLSLQNDTPGRVHRRTRTSQVFLKLFDCALHKGDPNTPTKSGPKKNRGFLCVGRALCLLVLFLHKPSRQRCRRT